MQKLRKRAVSPVSNTQGYIVLWLIGALGDDGFIRTSFRQYTQRPIALLLNAEILHQSS